MKICFFGVYNPSYSRNEILLSGLREIGVEIIECRADWRDRSRYLKLWKSLRALKNNYDFVYAAYPSPVATIFAKFVTRKPVVSDAFYSMFDSVVNDRREIKWWHPKAIKLLITDWVSVLLADIVITDTEEHKKYWSLWWGVNDKKIHTVYLGVNDKLFYPISETTGAKKDHFVAFFYGTYIPLQGVEKIIEAARICVPEKNISFRFVGSGAGLGDAQKLAEKYNLQNLEFISKRVPPAELNKYMCEADVMLGIFGDTLKAKRVIPNKVYDGLATKRAVITMDTPAIREIFSEKELLLVKNDPSDIAGAIKFLMKDEKARANFASHGYDAVCKYKPALVATQLESVLRQYKNKK